MQITKADNGGFVVNETPDTFLAAVSTVKELCAFIEGYYGTSAPANWIECTSESVPPFTDDTELVVIWKDGFVTHPQPWQSFSEHWKSVAYYRLVKGGTKAPMTWKAPYNDGWIEWSGGVAPVTGEVEVTLRNGHIEKGDAPSYGCCWRNDDHGLDIIRYRVL